MTIHQDIDKLFKRGLDEYSENPPNFVWNGIEQYLNRKKLKKKRNIIYSLVASIIILLSFGAGYQFTGSQYSNIHVKNQSNINNTLKSNLTNNSNNIIKPFNTNNTTKTTDSNKIIINYKNIENIVKYSAIQIDKQAKTSHSTKKTSSSSILVAPSFASSKNYNTNTMKTFTKIENIQETAPLDTNTSIKQ